MVTLLMWVRRLTLYTVVFCLISYLLEIFVPFVLWFLPPLRLFAQSDATVYIFVGAICLLFISFMLEVIARALGPGKIQIVGISSVIIALVACAAINSARFCWDDYRFHSDEEIAYNAIRAEIAENKSTSLKDINNITEFLERFGNCCSVSWISDGTQPLNAFFLLFGAGRWQVDMYYRYQRDGKERYLSVIYTADCCGHMLHRITEGN